MLKRGALMIRLGVVLPYIFAEGDWEEVVMLAGNKNIQTTRYIVGDDLKLLY